MKLAAVVAGALLAGSAAAQETGKLLQLINTYRGADPTCEGKRVGSAPPLAPSPLLANAPGAAEQKSLQAALERAGYAAERARAITLTGLRDADAAMRMLESRYCETLASDEYAEVGIAHEGETWRLVFAQPLLSPDLGPWSDAGHAVLKHTNRARADARACGGKRFEPAPPLQWDAKLGETALAHSREMAKGEYLGHTGRRGSTVGERASRHGYAWKVIGENVASGQGSAEQVVAGWLASPRHCSNIMDPAFTEMGAAYVFDPGSRGKIYWTQVLAAPAR